MEKPCLIPLDDTGLSTSLTEAGEHWNSRIRTWSQGSWKLTEEAVSSDSERTIQKLWELFILRTWSDGKIPYRYDKQDPRWCFGSLTITYVDLFVRVAHQCL